MTRVSAREKDGRRNRYRIQAHLPRPEPDGRERTIGKILDLLTGTDTDRDLIRRQRQPLAAAQADRFW